MTWSQRDAKVQFLPDTHYASISREGGMEGGNNPKCSEAKTQSEQACRGLSEVSGSSLFGLDLVPCAFVPCCQTAFFRCDSEGRPGGSSVRVEGSNPAPATKRTLGTPTYPEGFLASGVALRNCSEGILKPDRRGLDQV